MLGKYDVTNNDPSLLQPDSITNEKSPGSVRPKRGPNLFLVAAILVWSTAIVSGSWILWEYSNLPGDRAVPPAHWPSQSSLMHPKDRFTLLMFAHPKCSCTRASIRELTKIIAHHGQVVAAQVVFIRPTEFPPGWEKSRLWKQASQIPGVSVSSDPGGREADLFCAKTSGLVIVYDSSLNLRYFGGITEGRGHEGDNLGRTAVEAVLSGRKALHRDAFVFGCALDTKTAPVSLVPTDDGSGACCAMECKLSNADNADPIGD